MNHESELTTDIPGKTAKPTYSKLEHHLFLTVHHLIQYGVLMSRSLTSINYRMEEGGGG